jgi:arylsulfatase A-like enzyme
MIRAPGMPYAGIPATALVEAVDIYPTLAGLAGLMAPEDLDGKSLQPLFENPNGRGRDFVLSQFARPGNKGTPEIMGYSIRNATHRYNRWVQWSDKETVAEELYDYTNTKSVARLDAYLIEHVNLIDDHSQADKLDDMRMAMNTILHSRSEAFGGVVQSRPANGELED